jgi:photosystem II stability/assembly factor-like uncharacterized protein
MRNYNDLFKVSVIALICLCFISFVAFKADAANVSDVSSSPNPFNPYPPDNQSTTISYDLTYSAILFLKIYNSSDILVRDLVHPTNKTTINKSSGSKSDVWNGKDDLNTIVPEATYPYHIDNIYWISSSSTTVYSYDIAVNPDDSQIIWMTASDANLYKSTDGGGNWSEVTTYTGGVAYGIAISNDGKKIYVLDNSNDRLYYSTDGGNSWSYNSLWSEMGHHDSPDPWDIACSGDGIILYAVDRGTNEVYKSSDSGANWDSGVSPPDGTGSSALTGVAVDPNNSNIVLVADRGGNKVYKSTNGGSTFTTILSSAGTGDGQFNGPYQVSIDNSGYYWVSDRGNHRIQQFDTNNNWVMTIGGTSSGTGNYQFNSNGVSLGIFVASFGGQQYSYVADYFNNKIKRYTYDNYVSFSDPYRRSDLPVSYLVVTTDKFPPDAVTDLDTTGIVGSDAVQLTWTAPADATRYDVRYAKTAITTDTEFAAASHAPGAASQGTTEYFTVRGLESNTTYYFAIKALDEAFNESDISSNLPPAPPNPSGKTGLLSGWNMVSCPLQPSPNKSSLVFGDDAGKNWMFYWYSTWTGVGDPDDPDDAGYYGDEYGQANPPYKATTIVPGRGIFLSSNKTNDPTDATGSEIPDESYTLSLRAGWNLIGNPYGTIVNLSDCYVNETKTYEQAVNESLIGNAIYIWNGSTYVESHYSTAKLEPWKGYWIFAYHDLDLIIINLN